MAEQPQGTVTMLFTDIEGSTRLLQASGRERYSEALDLHRRLLREAFEGHGGFEVDCEGDSFFVAFSRAEDAVAAAAEAQQALGAAVWPDEGNIRVRIGIHTGQPVAAPPKYVGIDVHKAARIMAAGHGGQVLLSAATNRFVDGAETLSLGEHRLKDLLQPEPLYQLVVEGLPSEFPALKTLGNRPTNLPVQPNALVGREREVEEVVALLRGEGVRLVTLTGTGGTGKTRLALQAGAEVLDDFESGVFFVSLAPIRDPALVVPAIGQTLSVREAPGDQLADTLASYLEQKRMLLVLDNFEQVIEAAPAVASLLSRCLRIVLLVTSRERLRVSAERVYEVPSLALPKRTSEPASLFENEAVNLFVARAQMAKNDFELRQENAAAVVEVCHRVDGLPLALELAAARVAVLTPQALLVRLDDRLKLLTGGARDADERQQTLRATIDWSHDLLTVSERCLFARLSVFVDGCRVDAVEAVCDSDGALGIDIVDGLASLIEKSLLRQRADRDGEPRYWMLETISEYAAEQLEQAQETEGLRARHAEWCLTLAEEAEPLLWGGQESAWLERLEAEHENFRTALTWARDSGQFELAFRLAIALCGFWEVRGHLQEGDKWLTQLLAESDGQPQAQKAKALWWSASFAFRQGELARANASLEASITIFRQLSDTRWVARALLILGNVANAEGRISAARSLYEEAAATAREADDRSCVALAVGNLGYLLLQEHNPEAARPLVEESLALFEELGETEGIVVALGNLGLVAAQQDDVDDAETLFRRALRLSLELGYKEGIVAGFVGVAKIAGGKGENDRAARLLGAATGLVEATGILLSPVEKVEHERTSATARASLGDGLFNEMIESGMEMGMAEAVAYALGEEAVSSRYHAS